MLCFSILRHLSFVCILQLDYKVTSGKMEEVFRIAGNVIEVDIKTDKEGRSRGMGTVRFEHPMEAVQAVCILCDVILLIIHCISYHICRMMLACIH